LVTSTRNAHKLLIVAKPNHSSSWRSNQLALLAIAVPSLGAGIGFALAGAWPILPLAGLEITALGCALYYVNWKLQYRHVITLDEDKVVIDKGFYLPKQRWEFERTAAGLAVTPEQHPWDGPRLTLHNDSEQVTVGEFLNRDDCLKLLAVLRKEIRVGTHGPTEKVTL